MSPQLRVPKKRTIARLKGVVVTTGYYWGLLWKGMRLVFLLIKDLRKFDFAKT